MTTDLPADFVCPECQARYKQVRVRSQSRPPATTVQCLVCGHQLAAADSEDILKYFLVNRSRVRTHPAAKKHEAAQQQKAPPARWD
jgi:predicted Zn finger-like uncharacterized protein